MDSNIDLFNVLGEIQLEFLWHVQTLPKRYLVSTYTLPRLYLDPIFRFYMDST